ncbi:hypothetical protein B0H13DRAFT_1879869 [Mycena leptocephala]|nr:hypothetical protein B0H13DRAFT_1879869 [Mycena leptocephala]
MKRWICSSSDYQSARKTRSRETIDIIAQNVYETQNVCNVVLDLCDGSFEKVAEDDGHQRDREKYCWNPELNKNKPDYPALSFTCGRYLRDTTENRETMTQGAKLGALVIMATMRHPTRTCWGMRQACGS